MFARVGRVAGGSEAVIRCRQAELGDSADVARVLAFFASPDADYVHGTIFTGQPGQESGKVRCRTAA